MKIRTITCHDVYNLGASLQAYALQTYLESIGNEVQIIDYKPFYLSGHYQLWGNINPIFDKPLLKQLYLIAKLPERLLSLKRKTIFDDFTKNYLKLTRRYHNNDELKQDPPQADIYIAGSDQIWNTLYPNGKDPAFYLDFAPKGKRRISYAASFATKEIQKDCHDFISQMLQGLDAISVRERTSLSLLERLGIKDGVAVCDPVFLLTKEQWEKSIPATNNKDKYLVVYDFEHSPEIRDIATTLALRNKWKIYNIGPFKESYAHKNLVNIGPLEFVSFIAHSHFVITNSFHATAFSLIFNREMCVVNRKEGINERMASLLNDFRLKERLVADFTDTLMQPIDWAPVNQQIKVLAKASIDFLCKQMEKCEA